MKAIRWLLKLVLVIMTLPLILAVWLIKWFVVFLHHCSAWIFYLLGSVLLATAILSYLMQQSQGMEVTNEHTQKEVTDYIKKVYNPANKDRQIGFQLTRRPRRKYKEDDLTYNRNLLGHGDIEKAVSEEKIRQLSRSIMDVLWFSLWNKAE